MSYNLLIAMTPIILGIISMREREYIVGILSLICSVLILFDFGCFLGDQGNVLILLATAAVIGVCGIVKVVSKKSRGM